MRCTQCGEHEAVIQFTHIEDNETSTLHLCDGCAAERGVDVAASPPPGSAPLTDFLAQMGKSLGGAAAAETARCPSCGLGIADLKRTGRLGCSGCYAHFGPHLRTLLRRLHGGTQHVGKKHAADAVPRASERSTRVSTLRRSLQRAVEAEDFERAAQLRDELRELEASGAAAEDAG